MKRETLKERGLADDVIDLIMKENGADIEAEKAKSKAASDKLDAAIKDRGALTEKVKAFETTGADSEKIKTELENLKKKIKDDAEAADRKAKADAEEAEFTKRFGAVSGAETKFANDYTRDGIYRQFRAEASKPENKGKGDKDIYEALTKDKEGIFANPNPPGMPKPGSADTGSLDDNAIRSIMGLPPKK